MSTYFRKSIKIAPGVHINLSKRGTGISFGGRGGHVSFSPTGRITKTVSIPGTGIYYRDVSTKTSRAKAQKAAVDYAPVEPAVQSELSAPAAHQVEAVEHHGFYVSHGFASFASIFAAGAVAEAGKGHPASPWVPFLLTIGGISFALWLRDLIHIARERKNSHG